MNEPRCKSDISGSTIQDYNEANTKKIYVPIGEKVTNEASSSDETSSYPKDALEWGNEEAWNNAKRVLEVINKSDSEDVDQEIIMEERSYVSSFGPAVTEGASTPDGKTSNGALCSKGTRIILGWNANNVDVNIIAQDDQVMHARLWLKADKKELFCSFIYAHTRYIQWRALWEKLRMHKVYARNRPYCMLGDFNAALNLEDMSSGSSNIDISMREFKNCVEEIKMMYVHRSGLMFTWNQKPKGSDGVQKKIDRVMANPELNDVFAGSYAFANFLIHNDRLKDVVKEGWLLQVSGFCMFRVVKNLKNLKKPLRKLLFSKEEEAAYVQAFNNALVMQEWLDVDIAADTVWPVTDLEVKEAMFSMGNDKSPGLDGFTVAFFKEARDIMASDMINAVKEFFVNETLLKELNHMIIALIPKVSSPTRINDYRPISCCNLMHNYHLDRSTPRCAFKVDIQKAYDTADWDFLKTILEAFGFHSHMIGWIMECISTNSFSLSINGVLHGYFKGKRRLRQRDLISPYLFTLVMEVLTLMLQRRVHDSGAFTFHCYCSKMDLINLCFADDLFLFAHGDMDYARVIMEALDEFKLALGLTPSIPKSTAYFCNVLNYIKISILHIMPFEEGRLPVKYLGVPLVSSRLLYQDCTIRKGKSKVAWEVVCLPKYEGGLGLRRLELFWDVPLWGNMTWGWRKILQLRPIIHEFIFHKVGNGSNMSAWFDKWAVGCPLTDTILVRDMYRVGFDLKTKLSEVIIDNVWRWPTNWLLKYLNIISLPVPMFQPNDRDCLEWRDDTGMVKPFSVAVVWECIRLRNNVVPWFNVVWFSEAIPRHTFLMWLVIKGLEPNEERNWRLFMLQKRTVAQVIECIKSSVRLKLLSCSFKMSKAAKDMLTLRQLLETIICTSR
ncbi:hypothetical protein Tco_0128967 [Tanacetum coccineum]